MTDDMVGHISDCNLFTTQIQSAANGGRRVETRAERAPRGRLKALCDVMEPLIRHGHEMKSSEIDTPRPREGRAREKDSEAASFIKIMSDFAKAAIPQFAYLILECIYA